MDHPFQCYKVSSKDLHQCLSKVKVALMVQKATLNLSFHQDPMLASFPG